MIPDHYHTLGIATSASRAEIKSAYRKLALALHPDKNNKPGAQEQFIAVNEAYLILYDEEARAKYDREYQYYYGPNATNDASTTANGTAEQRYTYSYQQAPRYTDDDLNRWTQNAREQANQFARMAFNEFANLVVGVVKETGFQLGNALLVMLGAFLGIGGLGNLIFGLTSYKDPEYIAISVLMIPTGMFFYYLAHRNYDKHKTN